jgi:hypothetical protein
MHFLAVLTLPLLALAQAQDAASVIATSCATGESLLHTTLDAVLSIAKQNPSNVTEYIPVCSSCFSEVVELMNPDNRQ